MSRPYLALAAGGTGGHVFPAAALAAEMESRGWQVELFSDLRGKRFLDGFPMSAKCVALPAVSPFRGTLWQRFRAPFQNLYWSLVLANRFLQQRPSCIVAFGGYTAVPALAAAVLVRVPRVLHEQNAVLGKTNRLFLQFGAKLSCGLGELRNSGSTSVVTGNPVRHAIVVRSGSAYVPPRGNGRVRLLVIGGSQGSNAVSRLVSAAARDLSEAMRARLDVSCQARAEDMEKVEAAFADAGVEVEVAPFFLDLPERLDLCHLAVARAGASTLAELATIGRPAILIPLPTAANDHQSANARAFEDAGAAQVFPENAGSPRELARLLSELVSEPGQLQEMAESASRMGRPGAVRLLGDLVESCAGKSRGATP